MRDTHEIVKWVRKAADEMRADGQNGWPVTCDAAADTIERLEREWDEARETLRSLKAWDFPADIQALGLRLEAAEAQRDKLAEALRPLAKIAEGEPDTLLVSTRHPDFRRARSALKEVSHD